MKIISDLKQRHLVAWTKEIRKQKPDDVENITQLPEIEFDDIGVKAAIVAGWFDGVNDPDVVDEMKGGEVSKLSAEVWKAFREARQIDPN